MHSNGALVGKPGRRARSTSQRATPAVGAKVRTASPTTCTIDRVERWWVERDGVFEFDVYLLDAQGEPMPRPVFVSAAQLLDYGAFQLEALGWMARLPIIDAGEQGPGPWRQLVARHLADAIDVGDAVPKKAVATA